MRYSARLALSIGAAALFTGCGGSQPPIGALGAMPQSHAFATHRNGGGSWMLPEAKRESLLYVVDSDSYNILVYSYPAGNLVGMLSGFYAPGAACADDKGHVFLSEGAPPEILEYKHGGTMPIAILQDGSRYEDYLPTDCSFDRVTGNLAVANVLGGSSDQYPGNIAIYAGAQGSPSFIFDNGIQYMEACAYDDRGNLYVDGSTYYGHLRFAKIKHGEGAFEPFKVNRKFYRAGPLVWYANHLTLAEGSTVYQFKVRGQAGIETGTVTINTGVRRFAIRNGTMTGSNYSGGSVLLWNYPLGGYPFETITYGLRSPLGVAISPAR